MRLIVAPDKFKGSLSAFEAAKAIRDGWLSVFPDDDIILHPVADGGDGTLDAVAGTTAGRWKTCPARDARGRTQDVRWWWQEADRRAWIESAAICGLAALPPEERDPLTATSTGLGEAIRAAAAAGAQEILLCLGGSATNDAGCGMAAELGFRFLDAEGRPLVPLPAAMPRVARIEPPAESLAARITALTDVDNPLLGPRGASRVFGPQKGASPHDVETLDAALAHIDRIAARDLGATATDTPGTGAAGGLGFGTIAFLGGGLRGGFDTIAALTRLEEDIASSDLVLTAEGRLDEQTASGKAPVGVARLAHRHAKPVIAFGGAVPLTNTPDFDATMAIVHEPMHLEEAMARAGELLHAAAGRTARMIRAAQSL